MESKEWVEIINSAPKWAAKAFSDKSAGVIDSLSITEFPIIGEIIVGKSPNGSVLYNNSVVIPKVETEVVKVAFQQCFPRDETGFTSVNEVTEGEIRGEPVRIFIGTIYTGIILSYNNDSGLWYTCYSHGNFGNNCTHGGTWGSTIIGKQDQYSFTSVKDAISKRIEMSDHHIYSKSKPVKKEMFCVTRSFWQAVADDLRNLNLMVKI